MLQTERPLDEEQIERVLTTVAPIRHQFDDWYLPNLKQLTEIALKALSPGINDPGTALMVIDRQTEVMSRLMHTPMHNYFRAEEGNDVWFARHDYGDILTALMQEMRCYGKQDPLVVRRLLQFLFHLLRKADGDRPHSRLIVAEIITLLSDVRASITNRSDRRLVATEVYGHRRTVAPILARVYSLAPGVRPSRRKIPG